MSVENRTRITMLLPAPTSLSQFLLIDEVVTHLLGTCGGITLSSDLPPAFSGVWVDDTQVTQWESNLLIIADAPVSIGDADFALYLDRLKERAQRDFGQDIIWITIHPVSRVATSDFVR
jgi:hypothetical protein